MKGSHQRIVDATIALIDRDGYPALTIAAIAAEAGVTRPTVYAHFGTLSDLTSVAVTHVATEMMGPILAEADKASTAADYIVDFIAISRAEIRSNRVLTEVLWAQNNAVMVDDEVMAKMLAVSAPLLDPAIARDPRLGAVRDDMVEVITRIAASVIHFSSAATESDEALRHLLRIWVDPVLAELAGRAGERAGS